MSKVYVASWQLQCCGEPFSVGDTVAWTGSTVVDRDLLAQLLGAEDAAAITHVEDHHDVAEEPIETLEGMVVAIQSVSSPVEKRDGVYMPVAGAANIASVRHASGWEPEPKGTVFYGYIVTLD